MFLSYNHLTALPPEIGQLTSLLYLDVSKNQLISLPGEMGQLKQLGQLFINSNPMTELPLEIGQLRRLRRLETLPLTFPPPDITSRGTAATLAYLRDYEAMQMRQTVAGFAVGVGAIAGVLLAFRRRQLRGLSEKKKTCLRDRLGRS